MGKEIWKFIDGYTGWYEASTFGRIKSLDRVVKHRWSGLTKRKGRILTPHTDKRGRLRVTLYKDGKGSERYVHHLVLEAFAGPRPEGTECCHNDGNPSNNRLDNLRWDSHTNNMFDKQKHGTYLQGAKSPQAKLTEKQVREIIGRLKNGETQKSIGEIYGIDPCTIWHIVHNKTWKHIKR